MRPGPFIAAILSLLACAALPARSAEAPDEVYAKYHRAAASGNLEELARYSPAAQRAEIAAMSAAQRDAAVKMFAATLPRAFVLRSQAVKPDGRSARLVVAGQVPVPGRELLETIYGTISLVMEGGEWKVAETNWSNAPPADLQAAPASAPAQKKAAAPAPGGGAMVGSTATPPARKLGAAKEPCVYKPVMSAEDIERCR